MPEPREPPPGPSPASDPIDTTAPAPRAVPVAVVVGVWAVAFVLLATRRPDAVLDAQFWAEDGKVFYAEAHASSAADTWLRPYAGYLLVFTRLVAALAQAVPLALGPTVFVLVALGVQALVPAFLVSDRMALAFPNRGVRALLAAVAVALPNSGVLHANLTNAQWHLGILACLVLVAGPWTGRVSRAFDGAVVILSGLTGPFCIVLAPVAALSAWRRHDARSWALLAIVVVCAGAQAWTLLGSGDRVTPPLGATPLLFLRILGGQVLIGGLAGNHGYADLAAGALWRNDAFAATTGVLALAIGVWAAVRGPRELRWLLLFGAAMLAASLAFPKGDASRAAWLTSVRPLANQRYWVVPALALICALAWIASSDRSRIARAVAVVLLLPLAVVGVPRGWRYPAYADFEWERQVRKYDEAPPGTTVRIPVNPPGWRMVLVKR